ncbi:SDR family NAD(P)-dependent oxidoreductase, partial [Thioclava sp. BHET1]
MTKTWFVTGSASGLGRAIAERVLHQGDNLVATARRSDRLDDLRASFGQQICV